MFVVMRLGCLLAACLALQDVFFLLLRCLDEQQPHRSKRPVGALLSSLTGIVLCLRNNDRSHKVEVGRRTRETRQPRQQRPETPQKDRGDRDRGQRCGDC